MASLAARGASGYLPVSCCMSDMPGPGAEDGGGGFGEFCVRPAGAKGNAAAQIRTAAAVEMEGFHIMTPSQVRLKGGGRKLFRLGAGDARLVNKRLGENSANFGPF